MTYLKTKIYFAVNCVETIVDLNSDVRALFSVSPYLQSQTLLVYIFIGRECRFGQIQVQLYSLYIFEISQQSSLPVTSNWGNRILEIKG